MFENIKAKIEALTQAFYQFHRESIRKLSRLRQVLQDLVGTGQRTGAGPNGNTVDADYEVVDETKISLNTAGDYCSSASSSLSLINLSLEGNNMAEKELL